MGLTKNEKIISRIYNNPETGFQSATKLFKKLKEKHPDITLKEIKDFINNQDAKQVVAKKKETFGRIRTWDINRIYQADLLDMGKYESFNDGYKWIMTVIDVYSRYAWAIPLKSKSDTITAPAFENGFKNYPVNLTTDNGKEFTASTFQKMLNEHNIKHWTHEPGNHNTLGLIERFNRTLRELLQTYLTKRRTKKWIDVLPKLIKNYNTSYHETVRSIPKDIMTGKQPLTNEIIGNPKELAKYQVGDRVRLREKHKTFTKMSQAEKFSREIYVIIKVNLHSYRIANEDTREEVKRTIKPNEILRVGGEARVIKVSRRE